MINWQDLKVDGYHTTASVRGGPKDHGEGITCQQAELACSVPAYSFLPERRESLVGNCINLKAVTNDWLGVIRDLEEDH